MELILRKNEVKHGTLLKKTGLWSNAGMEAAARAFHAGNLRYAQIGKTYTIFLQRNDL